MDPDDGSQVRFAVKLLLEDGDRRFSKRSYSFTNPIYVPEDCNLYNTCLDSRGENFLIIDTFRVAGSITSDKNVIYHVKSGKGLNRIKLTKR